MDIFDGEPTRKVSGKFQIKLKDKFSLLVPTYFFNVNTDNFVMYEGKSLVMNYTLNIYLVILDTDTLRLVFVECIFPLLSGKLLVLQLV